ncbi:MAG TPA: 5-(carboxyamino)imidazole ribonucleotide mutase [bacterium]|nr:5-(carboxyamino)imidazole ribonucleotide mutase [bacterium]HOL66322.1 5-(carboxyamino)imidazole ribonucleotide mutase [bacterium]HPP12990.1 5-(carboxyamino)imidazole ribonucleotide mutase [bacterium]
MEEKVAIVVGSKHDLDFLEGAREILSSFGVAYDVLTLSAHRNLDATTAFAAEAESKGYGVIIACAGMAAHLPGVIAAKTLLPVIGVPLPTSDIQGMDALLAIVQMPAGVPVATMAIGRAGVKNAALLATAILARKYPRLRQALQEYREKIK